MSDIDTMYLKTLRKLGLNENRIALMFGYTRQAWAAHIYKPVIRAAVVKAFEGFEGGAFRDILNKAVQPYLNRQSVVNHLVKSITSKK